MQEKVRYSADLELYSSHIDFGIFMKKILAISMIIFARKKTCNFYPLAIWNLLKMWKSSTHNKNPWSCFGTR